MTKNNLKKIILAEPRGFCAGVEYAIGIVEECLKFFKKQKIYILKEIVHNKGIVRDLEKKGAYSVQRIEEVPENGVIIFSAHGVPPDFYRTARLRKLKIFDATCPLVKKVHLEAIKFANQGYTIFYIGHQGHEESIGVLAEAPENILMIENKHDAEQVKIKETKKLAYLTQTTLSVLETEEIIQVLKERFPQLKAPPKEDICYATTNRQKAAAILAKACDLIFVLGSENSSNSQRLKETAARLGPPAFLIDHKAQIDLKLLDERKYEKIGITAGASAPEKDVSELVSFLKEHFSRQKYQVVVENLQAVEENISFRLPELKL